jgi:hypothetical protein
MPNIPQEYVSRYTAEYIKRIASRRLNKPKVAWTIGTQRFFEFCETHQADPEKVEIVDVHCHYVDGVKVQKHFFTSVVGRGTKGGKHVLVAQILKTKLQRGGVVNESTIS